MKFATRLVLLFRDAFSIATSRRKLQGTIGIPLYNNAAFLIANSAASAALNFVFWMVVARLYPAEAVGLSSALFSAVGILSFIATLGLDYGLIRFLPSVSTKKAELVNSCFAISGIGALAAASIFLIGLPLWSPALDFVRGNAIFIVTFIGLTVMGTLYGVLNPLLTSSRKARLIAIMTAIQGLLKIPLVMVMASYFTVFGIFASWGLAGAATLVFGILLFLPRLLPGYRPLPSLRRQVTNEMVHFSFVNFVSSGLWQSPSWLLPIMIVNILGGEATAYFFLAWAIAGLLAVIPLSIATSIFVEGSYHEHFLHRDMKRGLKFIAVLLLPALAVMLIIGDKLLLLFGSEYSVQGAKVLWVTALASLPITVNAIYMSIARVRKQYRNIISIAAAVAVSVLILSYILIPILGTLGVALAWLVSQSLVALAVLPGFLRVLKSKPTEII